MTKPQRLAVFFGRMTEAVPASSAAAAFALITATFTAVEDEMCTDADDRMFPPSGDFHFVVEGREDLDLYRQAAHDTIIDANGAILIRIRKTGAIVFEKAGSDGRKVEL
jgi:hypothetical protein